MLRGLDASDVAPEVAWKLVDTLFQQTTTMINGAAVFIVFGLGAFIGTGSGWYLAGVAYTFAISAWRFSEARRYARSRDSATPSVWAMRSLRSCWAAGAGWGAWSAVVVFEPDQHLVIVLVGIHAGLVTGGAARNCAVPISAIGQIFLSSVPMAGACILTGNGFMKIYAVNIFLYQLAALALVKSMHRQTLQLLLKEKEKSDLVDRLENAKQDLEVINQHLETLVATDALTGIANRRSFDLVVAREWRHAARERVSLSLLMIDVDHFKAFNDLYGHQAGDACLRKVAQAANGLIQRPRDVLARYGGEEFALVLPATPLDRALEIAHNVLTAVTALGLAHDGSPLGHVTVSIGAACMMPNAGNSVEGLTAVADAALYAAKRGGRNRVHVAEVPEPTASLAPDLATVAAR